MAGENSGVLTDEEKGRLRSHLGYIGTQPATSIQLGIQGSTQVQFIVEGAMNRIPVSQMGMVRRWLAVLDSIEAIQVEALERLAANQLGDITLNPDEMDDLEEQHTRWARKVADFLGCPLNPYSSRFADGAGRAPLNVPVRR